MMMIMVLGMSITFGNSLNFNLRFSPPLNIITYNIKKSKKRKKILINLNVPNMGSFKCKIVKCNVCMSGSFLLYL